MRIIRTLPLALLIGCAALVATPVPSGAAGPVQKCASPAPPTQSGRATITPGINGLAHTQTIVATVHLFQCTPSTATMGSGALTITVHTPAVTCTQLNSAHTWSSTSTITWKNGSTTTVPVRLGFNTTRLIGLSGKVSAGLFVGHNVTGQLQWKPVVSPNGHTFADACANKVAPVNGGTGRVSIVGLTLVTTKPLTIT